MKFYVEDKVLDIGVKIVFAAVYDIDNHAVSGEWRSYREVKLKELLEEYRNIDVHSDPVLEGFNILHDKSGVKRRKNVPASENLIKLLVKHEGMPLINQAVDIYNIISIESKLALGAHDMDKTDGNVTLRFTNGSEKFWPIGQAEPVISNAHEYSYCDDANEVLCRLEIRQVEKTKVTEEARNIFYIVQGNDQTSDELLHETAKKIVEQTTGYCGGTGEIIIPKVITVTEEKK